MDGCPPVVMPGAVHVVEEIVAVEVDAPVLGRQRFVANLRTPHSGERSKEATVRPYNANISAVELTSTGVHS